MSDLDRYGVPAVVARVAGSDIGSEGVLFLARMPDGLIHRLNGTAAIIHELAPSRAEGDVVTAVAEAVGLDAAVVDADVRSCLADLVGLGLLERVPAPGQARDDG